MKQAFIFSMSSALCFSIMNVFVKLLGQGMPSAEINFFRGLIGTVSVLIYMGIKNISFSSEDKGLLFVRGVLGGLGTLCNFLALAKMKLADASILFQLSGIFVFIFSTLVLKEKLPKGSAKWLFVILVAVIFMVNPWTYSSFSIYALFAIGGAAFSAAAYTTIRKISLNNKHSTYEIMAYFLITSTIVGAAFMINDFVVPNETQWLYIIIIGLISVVAQFFMTGAFIVTNAVVAQFMQYISVFFHAFWGFVIFDEFLSPVVLGAGIVLFIASVMLAKIKENEKHI